MALVASFAPERSEGANDATRATNKQYALQKSSYCPIQVDPTSFNLASAMLNSKIRPRAVVGYGVKIFHPSPPNYVTRSPGMIERARPRAPVFFA